MATTSKPTRLRCSTTSTAPTHITSPAGPAPRHRHIAAATIFLDVETDQGATLGATHPPAPHASQQLEVCPGHAVPCFGALQCAASRLMLHLVLPFTVVRQHVTNPGFPQVDRASHATTARLHCFESVPLLTAFFAT